MKLVVKRLNYIIFFLSIAGFAHAQDLSGIWRGHFRSSEIYQRLMADDDRYKMEIQIAQHDKKIQAVTYSYKTTVFYGKAEADGSVDSKTKKVMLRELKIVEVRMLGGVACIMTCYMQYSKLGDEEFLEGTYTSMSTHDSSDCGRGTIFLHKVPETDFYKEPFLEKREKEMENEKKKIATVTPSEKKPVITPPPIKKPTTKSTATSSATTTKKDTSTSKKLVIANKHNTTVKPIVKTTTTQRDMVKTDVTKHSIEIKKDSVGMMEKKSIPAIVPRVIASRSNELVKSIKVTNPEVILNIYDDGAIDNDTVSVYYDNKLIVSKARLTDQPIVVKLHIEPDDNVHEVVMVAENLGDIPPNTSLMIVKVGEKRYEVRIVSTEQKNAVVQFKYEKPEE